MLLLACVHYLTMGQRQCNPTGECVGRIKDPYASLGERHGWTPIAHKGSNSDYASSHRAHGGEASFDRVVMER